MYKFNIYLNFDGNAEEAFNFYRSIFGGEFSTVMRFKDTPDAAKFKSSDLERIMHIALPIGNGNMLMGSDTVEGMGPKVKYGNNFYLSISAETEKEVDEKFKALSAGGAVQMAPQAMFWGGYFSMFTDKFGINWMVDCEKVAVPA